VRRGDAQSVLLVNQRVLLGHNLVQQRLQRHRGSVIRHVCGRRRNLVARRLHLGQAILDQAPLLGLRWRAE